MSPVTRDTQLSLVEGMDRPVGPILPSVFTGTNADLMAAVAPLYLTGSVLDVTYGEGKWWDRFTPEPFTAHDLYKLDGVDFRDLPEADRSVDAVCYDPPYVPAGGAPTSSDAKRYRDGFGLAVGRTHRELDDLVHVGLSECCRVADRFVLAKCMEFVGSGGFHDMPTTITNWASSLGWKVHDRIVHHTGSGPGGHNISEVKRARRHHSYLLVFARTSSAEVPSDGAER